MRNTDKLSYPLFVFILLSGFIALSPSFDLVPWAVFYDERRIIEVSLYLLALGGLIFSKDTNYAFQILYSQFPWQTRWVLVYILCAGLLSALLAPYIDYALLELSLFCLIFCFCLFTAGISQDHKSISLKLVFIGIVVSAFFYEIRCFTSVAGAFIQSNPLKFPEPFSGFTSVRFFNQFQVWSMPLLSSVLLLYGKYFNPTLKVFIGTIIIGWWVLLYASESRGAMFALGVSLVITFAVFHRHATKPLLYQALFAVLACIVYLLIFVYLNPLGQPVINVNTVLDSNGRFAIWNSALGLIKDNPWLGTGPMHFAYHPNPGSYGHPHNSILQIAAEWGLPTAVLVISIFFWGMIAWARKFHSVIKQNHQAHKLLWIILFNTLLAGSVYSLVSGVIVMPLSQLMLAVTIGIMLGMYFQRSPGSREESNKSRILLSGSASVLFLITLIVYWPHIQQRITTEPPYLEPTEATVLGPRIWQDGGMPRKN